MEIYNEYQKGGPPWTNHKWIRAGDTDRWEEYGQKEGWIELEERLKGKNPTAERCFDVYMEIKENKNYEGKIFKEEFKNLLLPQQQKWGAVAEYLRDD